MGDKTEQYWKERFDNYDRNKDGVITLDELGRFLQYAGFYPTPEEEKDYIKRFDVNKNDGLEFKEMYELIQTLPDPSGELMDAFRLHDKNGDGHIDKQELKAIFISGSFCPDDIDGLFELVDVNNDGKIEYKEFVELFGKDS